MCLRSPKVRLRGRAVGCIRNMQQLLLPANCKIIVLHSNSVFIKKF